MKAETILIAVANEYAVDVDEILGPCKSHSLIEPRHLAMYITRQQTKYSYPKMAEVFNRDHTTIVAAVKKIGQELEVNNDLKHCYEKAMNSLNTYHRNY